MRSNKPVDLRVEELRESIERRFLNKVTPTKDGECWEWRGYKCRRGYGRLGVRCEARLAHRVSWELFCGPIPQGIHVLHHCDNPPCVNPAHLWLGTDDDNRADKIRKNRQGASRGETHTSARLREVDVCVIMLLIMGGKSVRSIAREHGLAFSTIESIKLGITWKSLTGGPVSPEWRRIAEERLAKPSGGDA